MAWLHATPKPPEGSKRAKASGTTEKLSRLERMKRDGLRPSMPPNPMPHLIARLIEIGLTDPTGMGAVPLTWQTLAAWQVNTGVDLLPWEARLIRSLSVAYVSEGTRAENENCPPPWSGKVTQQERITEEARLRMVLG